ncbi:MAG: hypothetical protein HY390_04980 [Deltaproteobacteria bacterium]|nr:hypothetical protein [Deltaproteobacteria bacterium]
MKLMLIIIILVLFIVSIIIIRNLKDTYISEVVVAKPFDVVWEWISNPLKYAEIYPNWIKSVEQRSQNIFQVQDQFGSTYDIELIANKIYGIVDLSIGPEISRSRLYALDEHRTAIVHFSKRLKNSSLIVWFFHKLTTDKDLKHAKKIIEQAR